jgi:hypothetical protein
MLAYVHDDDPQGLVDLRRGEADAALVGAHGLA